MEPKGLKRKLQEGLACNKNGYFDSYKDNIYNNVMDQEYQKMFDKGSGSELHSKAEAVHSSSMLSYNLFHWIKNGNTFTFEGVEYKRVYFEVQMRTLSCRSNPANMDVVLDGIDSNGKRHLLFVESKFTEYLSNNSFKLSESYLKEKNWYNKKIDWSFIINKAEEICRNKCYGEGIKQAITHLFGINGLYGDERALVWLNQQGMLNITDLETIEIQFANFIFEPDCKCFYKEHQAYSNYIDLYTEFVQSLPNGIVLPKIYSYSNVWEMMKNQIQDCQLKNFVEKRYMNYAQK